MHGTAKTRMHATAEPAGTGAHAVVWLGQARALIVRETRGGAIDEAEVELPDMPAATPTALAEVAHRIGAVDLVLVLGPEDLRTALEREIVAIGHAPETIRETAIEGPVDRDALLATLRRLG
jgi:hypothetical protein